MGRIQLTPLQEMPLLIFNIIPYPTFSSIRRVSSRNSRRRQRTRWLRPPRSQRRGAAAVEADTMCTCCCCGWRTQFDLYETPYMIHLVFFVKSYSVKI